MAFKSIDKDRYQRQVSRLQWGLMASLFVVGLGLSELYHGLWPSNDGLWLNLAAVVSAVAVLSLAVYLLRQQPWMANVRYVLALKGELNRIYRASRKLEAALAEDNTDAIIVRYYSLHGSLYVYQLENNTLTLEELTAQIRELDAQIERLGLSVSLDDYQRERLQRL